MKAIILAAGRGERMRPLTDKTPKPLLKVGDKMLIEYHLINLANAGFKEIVINVSYHPQQFVNALGDGSKYGVTINYSFEPETEPLETGGGILQALPLLGNALFAFISADLYTDFPLQTLPKTINGLAHLVLVNNPPHHPQGDFCLQKNKVMLEGKSKLNFAGIGIYDPKLFSNNTPGKFPVAPLLIAAIKNELVTGEYYKGQWENLGTIAQLEKLQLNCV